MLDAPLPSGRGGCLYLDDRVDREQLVQALTALGAGSADHDRYVVYADDARDVAAQRYLTQMRIVLPYAADELDIPAEHRRDQPQTLGDMLWSFVQTALEDDRVYGEGGDVAYARVGFGLWLENADSHVLRVWSRPFLLTK
jgi:hypothetical protein